MKGVYVLIISVDENIRVKVRSLSTVNFESGIYAYVGSAQNNLEKRINAISAHAKNVFGISTTFSTIRV
jgi:Uri superfamily endonuclease